MLLEYLRRPARMEDWNKMVDAINKLNNEIQELKEEKEILKWEALTYDRFLEIPSDFFIEECFYTFPFTVNEEIDSYQTYGYLKNIYKLDRQIQKDIEEVLNHKKGVLLSINISQKEVPDVAVSVAKDVESVKNEKPKKKGRKKTKWI